MLFLRVILQLQIKAVSHRETCVATLIAFLGTAYRAGESQRVTGVDKDSEIKFIAQPEDQTQFASCRLLEILYPFP